VKKEIENTSAEESKLAKDFLKDTRTSGLNLDNIFAYLVGDEPSDDSESIGFGVTLLIDDVKTFEELLKQNELDADDIERRKINSFNVTIQWNDEIAVISSRDMFNNGIDVFNDDEAKSILANELFKSEYSGRDDAYLYFEYDFLSDAYLGLLRDILDVPRQFVRYPDKGTLAFALDMYKDMSTSIRFNAEKGEFVATGKMLPEDKATALFEKIYKKDFDSDLYKYFPDKSLLAFKAAVKPLGAYNEYYKKYFNNNDEIQAAPEAYDEKTTSMLGCFSGDILGSLSGINNLNSLPDFAVAAGITEGKENDVAVLAEEAGFAKQPEGYYSLNRHNLHLYFAVNNKVAYLTGSTEAITKFLDNSYYASDITVAKDFGKELKNALSYFYLDININDYPAMLKSLVEMSSNDGRAAMPLLDKLKSINASATGENNFEFKITFNDNEYASKTLLKGIDEVASAYLDY
jgi:hypothetical protein